MIGLGVANITYQHDASISAEETLGKSDTPDGGVVERALKPLRSVGLLGVTSKVPQLATKRAETLTPHGVALVGHGGRTDLVSLERLLDLLEHGKMPDVATNALNSAAERAESVQDIDVDLAGVSLGSADLGLVEAGLLGDKLIELLDKSVVALEDGEERALGTGRALDTTELAEKVVADALKVAEVVQEVGDPQRGTLADGDELGGLTVGVAKTRQGAILHCELGEPVDDRSQLGDDEVQSVSEEDQVGVVGHVAVQLLVPKHGSEDSLHGYLPRSGAPVDNSGRLRCNETVSVHVSHDIVAPALLLESGGSEFVVLNALVGLQLSNGLLRDVETELTLRLGEEDPKLSPGDGCEAK
jgi:hypothetical protein